MDTLLYKLTDDELRDEWICKYPDTIYTQGQFYRNVGGIWCLLEEYQVRNEIIEILIAAKKTGIRPTGSRVTSVLALLIPKIYKDANILDSNPDLFAFKNGVVNLKTKKFSKHSKDNYVSIVVDYSYDPNAICPNFMSVIQRFNKGTQQLLKEFMGYCLTTETHHEILLWLYGPPGSGKSTLIKGFETLLGGYCKHLPARCFDDDRFGKIGLVGARFVYATEVPRRGINDTTDLKAIVSGESIYVEYKHKDGFTLKPYAKIAWGMNYLPSVDLLRDGLGRRLKVINFPPLQEEVRDPKFINLIAQEGPGIFNFAFKGLLSLRKREKFIIPESVKQATEWCKKGTPTEETPNVILQRFIGEMCLKGDGNKVQAGPFGEAIRKYCKGLGIKELNSEEVSVGMQKLHYSKSKHNGRHYYHGMSMIGSDE